MNPGLMGEGEAAQEVRIQVAAHQEHLEEKKATGPDARGTSEPGQDVVGEEGLDLEQQESAQENGASVANRQIHEAVI